MWYVWGYPFESRAPTSFYFPTRKYFTIWFKFLDFLRSVDRLKVLIRFIISSCGLVETIWGYGERGHAFESHAPPFFYFPTRKYFTIWFKFLDLLRSLDRFKVLIRVIISEFYIPWRKKSVKIYFQEFIVW